MKKELNCFHFFTFVVFDTLCNDLDDVSIVAPWAHLESWTSIDANCVWLDASCSYCVPILAMIQLNWLHASELYLCFPNCCALLIPSTSYFKRFCAQLDFHAYWNPHNLQITKHEPELNFLQRKNSFSLTIKWIHLHFVLPTNWTNKQTHNQILTWKWNEKIFERQLFLEMIFVSVLLVFSFLFSCVKSDDAAIVDAHIDTVRVANTQTFISVFRKTFVASMDIQWETYAERDECWRSGSKRRRRYSRTSVYVCSVHANVYRTFTATRQKSRHFFRFRKTYF